jgi:hypothetical protein
MLLLSENALVSGSVLPLASCPDSSAATSALTVSTTRFNVGRSMCALVLRYIGYTRRLHNPILSLCYLTLLDGSSHVNNPRQCCSTQFLCEGQSAPRLTPFVISFTVFTHDAAPALLGGQPVPSYTSHAQLRSEPTEEVVGSPPELTAKPSASAAMVLCCACHGSHRTVHVLSAQFVTTGCSSWLVTYQDAMAAGSRLHPLLHSPHQKVGYRRPGAMRFMSRAMMSMPRLPIITAGTPIQEAHRPCGTCDASSSAVAPPAAQCTPPFSARVPP